MARSLQERLRALQASVGAIPQDNSAAIDAGTDLSLDSAADGESHAPGGGSASGGAECERAISPLSLAMRQAEFSLKANGFRQDGETGVWHRAVKSDVLTRHGYARFADMLSCNLQAVAKMAKVEGLSPDGMRFYDTETTGLGTGAGTIPFLHAVGQFEEDEFVVHQYFLADYSQEGALLAHMLREHFQEERTVVSFNGKSFDWPLLRGRLTMHRLSEPEVNHVDLLHPSRRFWRKKLPRVSLSQVEESILGLVRTDDVPGKEAPERYFEFIADGEVGRLMPVFNHNATDVCSLVTLTVYLSDVLLRKRPVEAASEWTALARVYDEWEESELAAHCFLTATECPDASWREYWLRSLHTKRRGEWTEAIELWEDMASRYPWSMQPCVELAKAYEHRVSQYDRALLWAKEAKLRAKTWAGGRWMGGRQGADWRAGDVDERIIHTLDHRIARIERKSARAQTRSES